MEAEITTESILTHPTESELADAVEENVYAMFRAMTQALGGEIEESPNLGRYFTAPFSPIFKGAFQARLAPDEADEVINETIEWFKARSAPFFFWWTGQHSKPDDLGKRLLSHGFTVFEKDAPAMVAEIDQLNWSNPRPPELRLAPIENEEELLLWKLIFIESFGVPEFAGQAWVDATQTVGIGQTPWHLLLGTMNGEPVSCGLLTCGAGVAGLLGLGTLPTYRKRGIGSAMQLARLQIARELGYRYAVLFASEMGYSPYLKLGFKDTGRRVTRYLWRNA
jgi:GNAT superfamily N-acetyltransferase